jgi:hypothetical protein
MFEYFQTFKLTKMKKLILTALLAITASLLFAKDDTRFLTPSAEKVIGTNQKMIVEAENCTVTSSQTSTVSVGESTITINSKCTKTAPTCKEANAAAQTCANDQINKTLALVLIFTGW